MNLNEKYNKIYNESVERLRQKEAEELKIQQDIERARQEYVRKMHENFFSPMSPMASSAPSSSSSAGSGGGRAKVIKKSDPTGESGFFYWQIDGYYKYMIVSPDGSKYTDLLNMGVTTNWEQYSWFLVQNSGYVFYFYNNDTGYYRIVYIRNSGEIIEDFIVGSNNTYQLGGDKVITFYATGDGVDWAVKIFDGLEVTTKLYEGSTEISHDVNFDNIDSSGGFVITVTYGDDNYVDLVYLNGDVESVISSLEIDGSVVSSYQYIYGSYTLVTNYNIDTDLYVEFFIYDATGNQIIDQSVSAGNVEIYPYGIDKLQLNFNEGESTYHMFNYNGVSQTMVYDTQEIGEQLNARFVNSRSYYPSAGRNYMSNTVSMVFYNDNSSDSPFINIQPTYAYMVILFNGDTDYTRITLQDTGSYDKIFSIPPNNWTNLTNTDESVFQFMSNNLTDFQVMVIYPNGLSPSTATFSLGTIDDINNSFNYEIFGDNFRLLYYNDNNIERYVYSIYDKDFTLIDSVQSGEELSVDIGVNVVILSGSTINKFFSSANMEFIDIGSVDSSTITINRDYNRSNLGLNSGAFLRCEIIDTTLTAAVISPDGISQNRPTIDISGSWDLRILPDIFTLFQDGTLFVYNYNGDLLYQVSESSNYIRIRGSRYFIITTSDYTNIKMITQSGLTSIDVTQANDSTSLLLNDFIYWDD
jgi:hypothetical protein